MNLGQIRTLARTFLSEMTPAYWSDAELNGYINEGISDFCSATDVLEDITTYSSIQSLGDYPLPDNYTKIKNVEFVKGNSIYLLQPRDLYESYQGFTRQASSPPYGYNLWEENLRLSERPSVSAASTTLAASMSATSKGVLLTDGSGLPRTGRILVDSEVIEFWNNNNGFLTPCTRGKEGTIAAAHSNGSTVYFRDIWIYHHIVDAILVLDTDTPTLPIQFHNDMAWYAAYMGRFKSKDYDLAAQFKALYDQAVAEGLLYVKSRWKRHRTPK
jgi:hypothetical protein